MSRSKKMRVIGVLAIGTIVIISACIILFKAPDKVPRQRMEYLLATGDKLPDLPIVNAKGQTVSIKSLFKEKPLILIYVRSSCKDCQAHFAEYASLSHNPPNGYDVQIIWDDPLSFDVLMKHQISADLSYTANRAYKLSDWVPTYFIVNAEGNISFRSIEMSELLEFLKDSLPSGHYELKQTSRGALK